MPQTGLNNRGILTGTHFINGDIACAEGAIAAGCRFFAGYPITPSTEIAERIARRFSKVGGKFLQMEDEIASITCIQGAAWAGERVMTATSGPGFSLMQEGIGLAIMTETPCVIVDVQRAGPSTGLPTLVAQQDMMQVRWGTHGDYEIIAYCPATVQEMFDYTFKAFNIAELYRLPVFVMADEVIGHMTEKLIIPSEEDLPLFPRRRPHIQPSQGFCPYAPDEDLVPPMPIAGEGYKVHVTGLTHDERGYPVIKEDVQQALVRRLVKKIKRNAHNIIETKEYHTDDAEILIVSYGISARSSMRAVNDARAEGIKAGMLRLITAWPFPEKRIEELAKQVKSIIVPEINLGQMVREVERFVNTGIPVHPITHAGGGIHRPLQILDRIREEASRVQG